MCYTGDTWPERCWQCCSCFFGHGQAPPQLQKQGVCLIGVLGVALAAGPHGKWSLCSQSLANFSIWPQSTSLGFLPRPHNLQCVCVSVIRVRWCWHVVGSEQPSWIEAIYCMCSYIIEIANGVWAWLGSLLPFASSKSETQLYGTMCINVWQSGGVCQGEWQVCPEGLAGVGGVHLWPFCPSIAFKAAIYQACLSATLTPLWAFFNSLCHSIILYFSMPRLWSCSFLLYYSIFRQSFFLQNPRLHKVWRVNSISKLQLYSVSINIKFI